MEELKLTDLQTQEQVRLRASEMDLVLFISLNDILLVKEISKDISNTSLEGTAIYIGNEAKKVHLWRTKEPNSIPIYHGGADLKNFKALKVNEIPSFLVLKRNELFASGSFSNFPKPFIKNLAQRYPELKKIQLVIPLSINLSEEKVLEAQVKIQNIEKVTTKSCQDIEELKKNLEEKDRLINEILQKIEQYEESKKTQHKPKGIIHHKTDLADGEYWVSPNISDDSVSKSSLWIDSPQLEPSASPKPAVRSKKTPVPRPLAVKK